MSNEYKLALEENNKAIAEFKAAQIKFRTGKNFDADSAEFFIAQVAYKAAMAKFDVAFAKEEAAYVG